MKKIIITAIAALIVVTMCFPVTARVPQKIKKLHPEFSSRIFEAVLDGDTIGVADITRIEARPGSELEIILAGDGVDADLFYDGNGTPINTADVTFSKMRAANVSVLPDVSSGGDFIKSVQLTVRNPGTPSAKPALKVIFASKYSGVYPADFDFSLAITLGGEKQEQSALRVAGTFGNPEVTVTASDDSADSGETVLVADEYISSILVDAGGGVTAEVTMYEGGRYLLSARSDGGGADLDMIPGSRVVDVIRLDTAGFDNGLIKNVMINGDRLYVYDGNGKALGMTGDKLPFSERYYLTDERIVF